MRIARPVDQRWTAPLAVGLVAVTVAATIVLLAALAWADTPAPLPAEVCAPGVMTITRGGPVVHDGVDCQLGPHAGASSGTTVVPSATVLRPMSGSSISPSADAAKAAVLAVLGGMAALLVAGRHRRRTLVASGLD
jgi:hypothetical protein